jgi:alpha-tubulin suppressor-like RCC1 family protein
LKKKSTSRKLALTALALAVVIPTIVSPVSAAEVNPVDREISYRYTSLLADESIKFSNDADKVAPQAIISTAGDLYTWFGNPSLPMRVNAPSGVKFTKVSSFTTQGDIKVSAIAENGDLYTAYGTNLSGATSLTMTKVAGLTDIVSTSVGQYAQFAVTATGEVYVWGISNGTGIFANGTKTSPNAEPLLIAGLSDVAKVTVSLSGNAAAAVTKTGDVYTWGTGPLGLGANVSQLTPMKIAELTGIESVALGGTHGLAKTTTGEVWSWGNSTNGELGHGDLITQPVPKKIATLTDVKQIFAGWYWSGALKTDNTISMWGNGQYGKFLDGNIAAHNVTVPTAIVVPVGLNISSITNSAYSLLAVDDQNNAHTWGAHSYGSLANGVYSTTLASQATPFKIAKMHVATEATVSFNVLEEKAVEIKIEPVIGATNYKISRNGITLTNSSSPSVVDSNLYAGVEYTYDIEVTRALGTEYTPTTTQTLTKKVTYTHTPDAVIVKPIEPGVPSAPVETSPLDTETEAFRDSGFGITSGGLWMFAKTTNLNKEFHLEELQELGHKEDIATVDELVVTDYSGTELGWSVFVTATPVTEVTPEAGFAEGTTAIVLPAGIVSLESTITTVPAFDINLDLQGIDSATPQKFLSSTVATPAGKNALPEDSTSVIKLSGLEDTTIAVDPINYPDQSTPYETTVKFTLVQGEI